MVSYFGDFAEDDTVNIPFNTFTSNDPSASSTITNLADSDIHVHKDGSITQAITDGATVIIDFDGITGNHMITIDTNADAYYATGSEYSVRVEGTTIDGATVNAWVGSFSIERAGGALALIKSGVALSAAAVDLVWDEVLTGATHNVTNSSGRRLRQIQEAGGYSGGAVYLDTVNGTTGTTDFENGVDSKQSKNIADANTIATSVKLSKFVIAPNSSIVFAATQDGQVFEGSLWTLDLSDEQVNETHIIGAEVSGVCTGHVHMDHCHLGVCSFAEGEFSECGLDNTLTITAANSFIFTNCYHEEDGAPSTLDFGSAVGATEVHMHGWKGSLLVKNMDTGDILHFSCAEGELELDSTNTAGTANLAGTFGFINGSSGMTINNKGQIMDVNKRTSANMTAISDDVTAADRFEAVMDATFIGQVNGGTPSTTVFIIDGTGLVDATDDHYKGRLITFTTGALAGQQTDVTASNGTTKALTVTALTEAPADDDFFNMT